MVEKTPASEEAGYNSAGHPILLNRRSSTC
jgi:hypothetical protein